MKQRISRLPKHAKFDFTDVFGVSHYHTSRKCYEVKVKHNFGKREIIIYSYNDE